MSQETKKNIQSKLKPVLAKWRMKGRLSVRNNSTLVLKLTEGPINFKTIDDTGAMRERDDINHYHYKNTYKDNIKALAFLDEIMHILDETNFNVGFWLSIQLVNYVQL